MLDKPSLELSGADRYILFCGSMFVPAVGNLKFCSACLEYLHAMIMLLPCWLLCCLYRWTFGLLVRYDVNIILKLT